MRFQYNFNDKDITLEKYSLLQTAFNVSDENFSKIMEDIRADPIPKILLNIEIIAVEVSKDLRNTDEKNDFYVEIYFASEPKQKYKSFCEKGGNILHIPVRGSKDDSIILEVSRKKNFSFKIRTLFKRKLFGRAKVLLSSIPVYGITMCYDIDYAGRNFGTITVAMQFTSNSKKSPELSAHLHYHLLKTLLLFELKKSNAAPYWWNGRFSDEAENMIAHHKAQIGLSDVCTAFIQWSVYTKINHNSHRLSFELFKNILDILENPLKTIEGDRKLELFWESTRLLMPYCLEIILELRTNFDGHCSTADYLPGALSLLSKIKNLEPPQGFSLFPKEKYTWMKKMKKA